MGGEIDWKALEIISEVIGVKDIETLLTQLCALRDHMKEE